MLRLGAVYVKFGSSGIGGNPRWLGSILVGMAADLVELLAHLHERGAVLLLLGGLELRDIIQPLLGVHAEQVPPHAEALAQRICDLQMNECAGDCFTAQERNQSTCCNTALLRWWVPIAPWISLSCFE